MQFPSGDCIVRLARAVVSVPGPGRGDASDSFRGAASESCARSLLDRAVARLGVSDRDRRVEPGSLRSSARRRPAAGPCQCQPERQGARELVGSPVTVPGVIYPWPGSESLPHVPSSLMMPVPLPARPAVNIRVMQHPSQAMHPSQSGHLLLRSRVRVLHVLAFGPARWRTGNSGALTAGRACQ